MTLRRVPCLPRRGWTLVETAIVLVVAGLLAGMAWPTYSEAVRRGRRIDAVEALATIQQAQERHAGNQGGYAPTLTALGAATQSPKGYYTVSMASATATGYTLTATAVDASSQSADGACATLTVAVNRGQAATLPAACWVH